jgi:hypothetical protein
LLTPFYPQIIFLQSQILLLLLTVYPPQAWLGYPLFSRRRYGDAIFSEILKSQIFNFSPASYLLYSVFYSMFPTGGHPAAFRFYI